MNGLVASVSLHDCGFRPEVRARERIVVRCGECAIRGSDVASVSESSYPIWCNSGPVRGVTSVTSTATVWSPRWPDGPRLRTRPRAAGVSVCVVPGGIDGRRRPRLEDVRRILSAWNASIAQSANPTPPMGSAGSLGFSTTVLAVVTARRMKQRIPELEPICRFGFYRGIGVATPRSSDPTEQDRDRFSRRNRMGFEVLSELFTCRWCSDSTSSDCNGVPERSISSKSAVDPDGSRFQFAYCTRLRRF